MASPHPLLNFDYLDVTELCNTGGARHWEWKVNELKFQLSQADDRWWQVSVQASGGYTPMDKRQWAVQSPFNALMWALRRSCEYAQEKLNSPSDVSRENSEAKAP